MLHVDAEKKETLNGGQCGFYIKKFVELYRMVVLQEIKMWNLDMADELRNSILEFNKEFSKLRIKKK
jgi:hypothetical protein